MSRLDHLAHFYRLLSLLEERLGGHRLLGNVTGRTGWPQRGVYFFFENGEVRSDSGTGPRVVRVGTHGLTSGSRSSLWNRLSNHQGSPRSGTGNHRGSIFRLLVGEALIRSEGLDIPTWGIKSDPGAAAREFGLSRDEVKRQEHPLEQRVTRLIGTMPLLWLDIGDEPGPDSVRGVIETNAIGLLSNYGKQVLDPPSRNWLGFHTSRERVQSSGLWNSNHVDDGYDPDFLDRLDEVIRKS